VLLFLFLGALDSGEDPGFGGLAIDAVDHQLPDNCGRRAVEDLGPGLEGGENGAGKAYGDGLFHALTPKSLKSSNNQLVTVTFPRF